MVAAESDRVWAGRGPLGEVRLNTWRNPSRVPEGPGRVTPVEPSPTKKRPKPIIAVLAVAVPLLAIGIAAVATSNRSDDGAATATTISQSGDPDAPAGAGASKGKGDSSTTAPKEGADDDERTTTTTAAKAAERDPEIPSAPGDAGPEGERTSVTYPQPTVPSGGCSRPSGTAVITLGSKPSPACLELGADQEVLVRNRTGKEISFVAISINEVVAPGSEVRIGTAGSAFGEGRSTFWSPGNPKLSGIVVVG